MCIYTYIYIYIYSIYTLALYVFMKVYYIVIYLFTCSMMYYVNHYLFVFDILYIMHNILLYLIHIYIYVYIYIHTYVWNANQIPIHSPFRFPRVQPWPVMWWGSLWIAEGWRIAQPRFMWFNVVLYGLIGMIYWDNTGNGSTQPGND